MFSVIALVFLAVIIVLLVALLLRPPAVDSRDDIARLRQAQIEDARALREELAAGLQRYSMQTDQRGESLRSSVTQQLETIRTALDSRLAAIQADNAARLEQMRLTVDEKLQSTLETRLGESFRLVSDRLEQVHKGLGEMQTLAAGVGDLKRVLGNVTTRGAWGEVQLENLLTQMLAPDQFERNVAVTGTGERVEFAIKLPGQGTGTMWLPIDAKFPAETYQRLAVAAERGDLEAVEACSRELETVIRTCARTFSNKYLAPPATTISGFCFWRPKVFTPKRCGVRASRKRCKISIAWCWPVRLLLRRC